MSAAVDGLVSPVAGASAVMDADKDAREGLLQDDGGPQGTASIDGLLQLHPKQLRRNSGAYLMLQGVFSRSHCTGMAITLFVYRLLRVIDMICLTNSIFISLLVLKTFANTWTNIQLLHGLMYGVVAAVQLLVMLQRRELYERYRLQVTCVHRVLQMLTLANACLVSNNYPLETRQVNMTVLTKSGNWSMLLRMVVGVPLMWLNHANYVLPFAYVLPAQLLTFVAACVMSRLLVCAMLQQQGVPLHLAQQLCQHMKLVIHYLGMLLSRSPGEASDAAAQQCQGLNGLVLLTVYANLVLLVMVPCLVVYFMELNLKMGFIRPRQLTLAHAPPGSVIRIGKAVVVHGAVVGSWLACEVLLQVIAPMDCNSAGLLVMGPSSV